MAAAAVAGAVGTAVQALSPAPPPTEPVPVAGRDLAAGHVLAASDLVTVSWPRGTRPDGTLTAPLGRVLATSVRRGEPLTDARVTGPGLLTGQPSGTVAVMVRLSDPASAVLVAPGRRIDVLGGPVPAGGTAAGDGDGDSRVAEVLADDVLVLAVPRSGPGGGNGGWLILDTGSTGSVGPGPSDVGSGSGPDEMGSAGADGSGSSGILVVAADRSTAARLAAASGARSISAVLTG